MKDSSEAHPKQLIEQYIAAAHSLNRYDKFRFKVFVPKIQEVLKDFNDLCHKFTSAGIYYYAGMCYLGAAKCERIIGNQSSELQCYLKSARTFMKADAARDKIGICSNNREYVQAAIRSYNAAISKAADDSVLKAAIIYEVQQLDQFSEATSTFSSPCHRIHDLEKAADVCIEKNDYAGALRNLNDIMDNLYERKKLHLYQDLLIEVEITKILLLIILNIPIYDQAIMDMKLIDFFLKYRAAVLEYCAADYYKRSTLPERHGMSNELKEILSEMVNAWMKSNTVGIRDALNDLCELRELTPSQQRLVDHLCNSTGITDASWLIDVITSRDYVSRSIEQNLYYEQTGL